MHAPTPQRKKKMIYCYVKQSGCNLTVCLSDRCSLGGHSSLYDTYLQPQLFEIKENKCMPFMGRPNPGKDTETVFDVGELLRTCVATPGMLQTFLIVGGALLERGYKLSFGVTKTGKSMFIGFGKGDKFFCAFGATVEEMADDLGALLASLDEVEKGLQKAAAASVNLYNAEYARYWEKALDNTP